MAFAYAVSSVNGTHFTGTIAQDATLNASLALPGALRGPGGTGRGFITSVSVLSEQALAWEVTFYETSRFNLDAANLNLVPFSGRQTLTVGTRYGGAGPYYATSGLIRIPVADAGALGQLHLSLGNRSVTTKLASAAGGAVVVRLWFEPSEPS